MTEPITYSVTTTLKIEIDIKEELGEQLRSHYEAETTEAALAESIAEEKASKIEPTEKLIALDVDVNGPSDE